VSAIVERAGRRSRERTRTAAARVRRSTVVPVLLAAAVIAVMAWNVGKPFGDAGDPTLFIHAGSAFHPQPLLPHDAYVFKGSGFDGQFFFYLAQDPLLLGDDVRPHLDAVSYRQQRILLPAIAFVLSGGGDPDALQWVLPAINLAAVLFASWVLAQFLRARGRSPWLALLFAGSSGIVLSLLNDVADPLAASLFVVGLIRWSDDRRLPALLWLTAACLARETYVIPVGAVVAYELLRSRGRAWPWLIPPAVVGAWTLYVRLHAAAAPDHHEHAIAKPDALPFTAVWGKLRAIANQDVVGAANWELLLVLIILGTFVLFAVRGGQVLAAALPARQWPARIDVLPVIGLATVVLVPFLTKFLWSNPLSYGRYVSVAPAILVMLAAVRRDRLALLVAAMLAVLTLLNPYAALLPTHRGAVLVQGTSTATGSRTAADRPPLPAWARSRLARTG
jgi:hypothetical protein